MNTVLWDNILQFDLDNPPGEYGFSIRLADENYWTQNFTSEAILEYKKFMYLAAISSFMVSPSEIVDIVWHQHLIFTKSYQEFCDVLGKQVQHVPSTHNRDEHEKFLQAKNRTLQLYRSHFGEPPNSSWNYSDMYDGLHLAKAKYKTRTVIIAGLLAFALLITPCYFLLRPLYITINNPYFILGFLALCIATFFCLGMINKERLNNIIAGFDRGSFICQLAPCELIYLKTGQLPDVVHATLSELINNGAMIAHKNGYFEMSGSGSIDNIGQLQTMNVLNGTGNISYPSLLNRLLVKPLFRNTANCMKAFKKYFTKSENFTRLFNVNLFTLLALIMLGLVRVLTGIFRDKPVTLLVMVLAVVVFAAVLFLYRLTNITFTRLIPTLYRNELLSKSKIEENWQWEYFLWGTAALDTSLVLAIQRTKSTEVADDGSSSCSSGGSSCGSSCSSCGGCGGGD